MEQSHNVHAIYRIARLGEWRTLGDPGCTTTTTGVGFLASSIPSGDSVPTAAVPRLPVGPGATGYLAPIFGSPTLPNAIPTAPGASPTSLSNAAPASLVALASWPDAVDAVWGMVFAAEVAGSPATLNPGVATAWGLAYTSAAGPQTPSAGGNTLGAAAVLTSEKMKGADAVFGSKNVDVVVPVTDPWVADGPFKGVSGSSTGAVGSANPPTDPLTNVIVPIGKALGSAADQVFLGGLGGMIADLAGAGAYRIDHVARRRRRRGCRAYE